MVQMWYVDSKKKMKESISTSSLLIFKEPE